MPMGIKISCLGISNSIVKLKKSSGDGQNFNAFPSWDESSVSFSNDDEISEYFHN